MRFRAISVSNWMTLSIRTEAETDGSIQSVQFPRQMNEIGTYVMFQKATLWTDHQSWKDCKFDCSSLNSFPRCATSYAGERGHCQLFPPPLLDNNEHKDERYDELDLSLFPNLLKVATNRWSIFRKQAAAPRKNLHSVNASC